MSRVADREAERPERICGKGTFNGAAAEASAFEFAGCVMPRGHLGACDSGPAPQPPPMAA